LVDTRVWRQSTGTIAINGDTTNNGSILIGADFLEVGSGRTVAGNVLIDLTSETGSPDYNSRIIRYSGANSQLDIINTGTGIIRIAPNSAAAGSALSVGNGVLGFFGVTAVAKPTITGSRGGNAALASLLTGGATLGLWTDSTTA
jgi:hypothetical protein